VHEGALGWNGFMAAGMFYWLVPRLWGTKLHSKSAADFHFWLGTSASCSTSPCGGVDAARAQAATIADGLTKQGLPDIREKKIVALIAYLQRLGTDIKKGQKP
jgi:hypothetical protein